MRIIVAPDSFKGSLTAVEAGHIIAEAIHAEIPQASIAVMPMADGGEGTVEAILTGTGGKKISLVATGPMGTPVNTFYGVIEKNESSQLNSKSTDHSHTIHNPLCTSSLFSNSPSNAAVAVIETAAVAGLTMVPPEKRNPLIMTTYGLGECIRHALDGGIRRFIIGLGGSATNDGGLGMLQALGVGFYDQDGNRLPDFKPNAGEHASLPTPVTYPTNDSKSRTGSAPRPSCLSIPEWISRISRVDFSALDPRLQEAEIVAATDVQSPLCGPCGASAVFGPQKGATPEQVRLLDGALADFANIIESRLGRSFRHQPGAGAAGGLGFAFMCIGGKIQPGAQLVIQASGLLEQLPGAAWLITGEGKTDEQTLLGKLPVTLAKLARAHGVRTILVSGSLTGDETTLERLYQYFDALFAIPNRPMALEEAIRDVRPLLKAAVRSIARLMA